MHAGSLQLNHADHVAAALTVQVLCGYDAATRQFDICDPACDSPRYTVAESKLDAARKSFGTDEDILVMTIPI